MISASSPAHRIIAAFILAALSLPGNGFATGTCESFVSKDDYRDGQHLTYEKDLFAASRKPEAGSLEDRHPGLVKKIVSVMYGELPYVRWNFISPMTPAEAQEFYRRFDPIESALLKISEEMKLTGKDKKLFSDMAEEIHKLRIAMLKDVSAFSPTSEHLSRLEKISGYIQSSLQELIVACLLAGEEFFFHRKLIDHYHGGLPAGIQRHARRTRDQLNPYNTEIDLIIKRRNGRDLWVEVKNNMVPWSVEDYLSWCKVNQCTSEIDIAHLEKEAERRREKYFLQGLLAQAKAQVESRDFIRYQDKADILFVTKHVTTKEAFEKLKDMGIASWPLFFDPQPFREDLFRAITSSR